MVKAVGPDDKIPCPTVECLVEELEKLGQALEGEEREETWERMERGIARFAAVTRGGGYRFPGVYVDGMLSDRGRLSGVATDFLTSMAPRLAHQFQPLTPLYIPPLIRLLARPNKVYLRRAEKCVMTIITHCPAPSLISLIKPGIEDKNEACRRSCGAALEKMTREWPREVIGARGVVELEAAMKRMATEKDAEVRKIGKRMWGVFEAKWPERIEQFTAPLTPTIKKYLDISQSKSSTARTLFPAPAPAARGARHPLAQTTTAPTQGGTHRPAMTRNAATTAAEVPRDRNMQAMRGLGRTGSTTTETTGNGIRPFLLRSTSAAVPSSSSSSTALRAGINRSVSVANVLGNEQLAEEAQADDDDGSTEGSAPALAISATRPRVITHTSTPDLIGSTSSAPRTQPAQRAAASGTGVGAVRRARVVSGMTHVVPAPGLGMGRPQGGAVRPATASGGRVVSTSATIGVGARSVGAGRAPVKPPRMVGQSATASAGVHGSSDSAKVDGEGQADVNVTAQPPAAASRTGNVKVITTNPGGTTKTRQFFRPTSSSATTHASSSTMRPAAEPRRTVGRSATGGARSGGLTAPTASSGAKVVQRALPDSLVPQTTGSSSGATPATTVQQQQQRQQQQAQAKPIVSPRRPRLKLKPPIPVFMPTSKARPASATTTGAGPESRPRVKASAAPAAVVEPANVPLPESPAPRRVKTPRGEEDQAEDPFATVMEVAIEADERVASDVPRENGESTVPLATTVADPVGDAIDKFNESESDHATGARVIKDESIQDDVKAAVAEGCVSAQTETPVEAPTSQLSAKENSSRGFEQTDKDTSETPAAATPAVEPADTESPIKVNLIDLEGPELDSPIESVHVTPSPAKRMPLGPAASPNQMSVPRKMATPKSKSPKIKQLSEFFENKAFSPEPSPERTVQLTVNARRPSTTPLSTPPRPRVLN
ncbi:hypothetical protein NliqN6_5710 [Naganishia liquefaciens]|uniref:CLASP N-terminal domain-containing protein n=1 Tax=Naganishia liquefaciens TaxID=104408 RepID=A0A8H3TYB8_9TREE|nr:hypothetical protein NliqN6_5710 [Naganishia liquefaciens]